MAELQFERNGRERAQRRFAETAARLEQLEAEMAAARRGPSDNWVAPETEPPDAPDDLEGSVADVVSLFGGISDSDDDLSSPAAPLADDTLDAETPLGGENADSEPAATDKEGSYEQYDEEEAFLNQASDPATAEKRRELDRERADRELELGDESFWMVCPRCGEDLSEHEFDNIKVERCESCGAVAIDKNEIELLVSAEEDRMISYRAKGLLH